MAEPAARRLLIFYLNIMGANNVLIVVLVLEISQLGGYATLHVFLCISCVYMCSRVACSALRVARRETFLW